MYSDHEPRPVLIAGIVVGVLVLLLSVSIGGVLIVAWLDRQAASVPQGASTPVAAVMTVAPTTPTQPTTPPPTPTERATVRPTVSTPTERASVRPTERASVRPTERATVRPTTTQPTAPAPSNATIPSAESSATASASELPDAVVESPTPEVAATALPEPTPEPTAAPTAAPFAISLPGTFEAEDYRTGGEGVGYHDWTRGNRGGAYRNDDVDIESCGQLPRCYDVAYIQADEWLAYSIYVPESGSYVFRVRTSAPLAGRVFHIELDGRDITGPLTMLPTGNYRTWADTISTPVVIVAGNYELRLVADTAGFNLDSVTVTNVDPMAPTPVP